MVMTWDQLLSPVRLADRSVSDAGKSMGDPWTEFDRDYGRAVFSSPVRRLQDKTQVFPLDPTDAVRTRLTHSLEVSSVARGLARRVAWSEESHGAISREQATALETVVATVALLHDIGNPPFGHAGEGAIRDWFVRRKGEIDCLSDRNGIDRLSDEEVQDFQNFEGNAQTIRLVSKLQLLVKDEGLNLTCAVMSALQKYLTPAARVSQSKHATKKPGFFLTEESMISDVRCRTGVPDGARNPLTLLMEAADDICYATVDIEDGIKKGVLDWVTIKKRMEAEKLEAICSRAEDYVSEHAPNLISLARDGACMQMFRTFAIDEAVKACAAVFSDAREAIMAGHVSGELIGLSSAARTIKVCKKLAKERVYVNASTVKLELLGRRVVSDLLDFFWMAAQEIPGEGDPTPSQDARGGMAHRAYLLISENYRRVFSRGVEGERSLQYRRLQMVMDQVSGMTDGYALRLHQEVAGG